jgi:hypothetical protein
VIHSYSVIDLISFITTLRVLKGVYIFGGRWQKYSRIWPWYPELPVASTRAVTGDILPLVPKPLPEHLCEEFSYTLFYFRSCIICVISIFMLLEDKCLICHIPKLCAYRAYSF